jgi:hypothetical protein
MLNLFGEKLSGNLAESSEFHASLGTDGFISPPKEVVLSIFSP